MHHRVHHHLEHRTFAELRHVAAGRLLPCRDAPVTDNGTAWHPGSAGQADLRCPARRVAGFRPDGCSRSGRLGCRRWAATGGDYQRPAALRQPLHEACRAWSSLTNFSLARAISSGSLARELRVAAPQLRTQSVDPRIADYLGVGRRPHPIGHALATTGGSRRIASAASCRPDAAGTPPRRTMDSVSRRYLDEQHAALPRRRREGNSNDAEVQRRFDAVRADLRDVVRQCVQLLGLERLRLTIVRNSQYKTSAARVGERRELVGKPVTVWCRDPAPR